MQLVSRSAFLEIQDSMRLLKSIYNENHNNTTEFVRCLRSWHQKHQVNILSGPTLLAFGWAIVVRFFELTKDRSGGLPRDLGLNLNEISGRPKFDIANIDKLSARYACVIRVFDDTDERDHGIMICCMIRHLRNAFSHFDCHYDNDSQCMRIQHIWKGHPKIDMDIQLISLISFIGDIGILFHDTITELNLLEADADNIA